MLDYINLPDTTNGTVNYFYGSSQLNNPSWVIWEKPTGCHLIKILCIAGGGGGSSGYSSNTTTSRGGGGAGGGSGVSTVLIPSYFLPDRLYISVGLGGSGGANGPSTISSGSAGVPSYVCVYPEVGAFYRVCYANPGNAGGIPSTTAGGTGGTGGTQATIADMPLASNGNYSFLGGTSGGTGGFNVAGTTPGFPTSGQFVTGGGGGAGGTNSSGGGVGPPTQPTFNILPSLSGVLGSGIDGRPGREIFKPLIATGGGGGSANSGTGSGGRGADGGFGSGGGGGGAGGANSAGGGGKGGNGLVIIQTW